MTSNLKLNPENMTDVLGLYIKDVIDAYPAVGAVLATSGIGCVTCNVGTCFIKDVVSIHNLTEAQEQSLFAGIASVVFPGRTVSLPKTERKPQNLGVQKLSPPLQALVDEHGNIKRVLALIPALSARIQNGFDAQSRQICVQVLSFIREYADRFHHAKEEDILFKFFEPGSDIITVMCKEHEIGRNHVRTAMAALEKNDAGAIIEQLRAYGLLLTEHIRKEDEILYPWMNRELTDSQVGKLFSKFSAVDAEFGAKAKQYLGVMELLEKG